MNVLLRWMTAVAGGVFFSLAASIVHAETWTDSTGNFKVEAEFVGVSGRSVTLRKADGAMVNVPIERLSPESRALAKRLYESQKGEAAGTAAASLPGASSPTLPSASAPLQPTAAASQSRELLILTASPSATPLKFTPPLPAPVSPMPPFPENASLQETVDFVQSQIIAGHPQVLWYALPDEIRDTVDDPEFCALLRPLTESQAEDFEPLHETWMEAFEILVTKKTFLLNSQVISNIPPAFAPLIEKAYDPAVGLLYEFHMFGMAIPGIHERSIAEILDEHGPRLGSHFRAFTDAVPLQMFGLTPEIATNETSADTGQVTVTFADGRREEYEMARYAGRWIPKQPAEWWAEEKDDLKSEVQTHADEFAAALGAMREQRQASIGFFQGFMERALTPLRSATTQEEFDQALQELIAAAGMMMLNFPDAADK